jgi:hypothetical protein
MLIFENNMGLNSYIHMKRRRWTQDIFPRYSKMPTIKELQKTKKTLKKVPKPTGNAPKLPTSTLLRLIAADPKIGRDKAFIKRAHELAKKK